MGITELFIRLVLSPETAPKHCNRALTTDKFTSSGFKKMTISSAYSEIRGQGHCLAMGSSRLPEEATWIRELSTPITKIKSMGERGSLCMRPRRWKMGRPGTPFTSTCVVEVDSNKHKRLHHRLPNSRWCKTSMRKGQETISKAFEIYSFKRM